MILSDLNLESLRRVRGESDSQRMKAIQALSAVKAEKCDYVPSPGPWCRFNALDDSQSAYYAYYRAKQLSGDRARGDDGYITLLARELLSSEDGMRRLYGIIGSDRKSTFRDRVEKLNLALSLRLGLPLQFVPRLRDYEMDMFLSDSLLPRYRRLPGRFLESLECGLYRNAPAEWLMDAFLRNIDNSMRKIRGTGLGE